MNEPASRTDGKDPGATIAIMNGTPAEMPAENPGRQIGNGAK